MRIESVEMLNYRQYVSVMYQFHKKEDYDLHIIKGKNGLGKTNVLNAITWCLYNSEPHLGKKNSGKPRINTSVLKKAREQGIEKCEIIVRVTISDGDNTIIFERKQEYGTEGSGFEFKPIFNVTYIEKSGETKVFSDDKISPNYVNMYMPNDIREYFFFDGEHLEKYFVNEQGSRIKEAIHVISQVQLLTSMKERLATVIGELQVEAGKKNKNIDALVRTKSDLEKKVYDLELNIESLKKQINISNNIVSECSEFLKGKEGLPDKEKEFQELQIEIKDKNLEKDILEVEIHKFIRDYKILFSFYPAIKVTYEKICEKEIEGAFPPVIDKNYLKRMLQTHKCLVCNRDLDDNNEKEVEHLLDQLVLSSGPSYILSSIKGELETLIEKAKRYKDERNKVFDRKKTIEKSIEKLDAKLKKIDIYLKQYSDREKIKDTHRKRMENMQLVDVNIKKLTKYELEIDKTASEIEEIKKQIKKDMDAIKEFDVISKKILFAERAKELVATIEQEMMDEVREKMKEETMEIFSNLEWKKQSFSHVELDKAYNLELFDTDGFPTVGTCSAGERALLALSFTLALQKVSGYDSMLFIDTPVGRIDTENRVNFAKVLKNVAVNKQVIITLTTSEYSDEVRDIFEPIASSFVELISEDEKITQLYVEESI